jgi:hypothetical protein
VLMYSAPDGSPSQAALQLLRMRPTNIEHHSESTTSTPKPNPIKTRGYSTVSGARSRSCPPLPIYAVAATSDSAPESTSARDRYSEATKKGCLSAFLPVVEDARVPGDVGVPEGLQVVGLAGRIPGSRKRSIVRGRSQRSRGARSGAVAGTYHNGLRQADRRHPQFLRGYRGPGEVRGHRRTARSSRSSRAAVWSIHRRSASRR